MESQRHIQEMAEATESAERGGVEAPARFALAARSYMKLLREHIQKEDHCLFPMVGQTLSAKDQTALREEFERFEREEIGETRAALLRTLDRLEKRFPSRKVMALHRA